MVREVREELGYELAAPRFLTLRDVIPTEFARVKKHYFVEKYNGEQDISSKEGFNLTWVHTDQLHTLDTMEGERELLQELAKQNFVW